MQTIKSGKARGDTAVAATADLLNLTESQVHIAVRYAQRLGDASSGGPGAIGQCAVEHPEQRVSVGYHPGHGCVSYSALPSRASRRAALMSSISTDGYLPASAPNSQG